MTDTTGKNDKTEPTDPLIALMMDNPPKDVFGMRDIMDSFIMAMSDELPEIGGSIDDVVIQTFEDRDLTVDIHQPKGEGPFPVLVYLHGGGWVLGSPKTHRHLAFRFAEAGYLVFNVDYRLAPESPFPAAYDDCETALDWVLANAADYGGDASRLAVGGDSAGGNLTAAVATQAAQADRIRAVLLIYPAMDFATIGLESPIPGLDVIELMVAPYIGHDRENLIKDPRVSPILAAEKLPDALITCGTMDDLLDDCERTAAALRAAGKPFETDYYEDMPHGFCQMEALFPQARQSINKMIDFLNRKLA